jgi:ABC-type antimicrobial peptide transport system permease subunit
MKMRLYSNLKYYRCHKGKMLLLVIPLFLSVFVLYFIHMIISSYYEVEYNAFVETRKYYTSIQARGDLIDQGIIKTIQANENTEKVVPCVLGYTEINGIISTVGIRVYLLYQEDIQELISRMGLSLSSGRLPVPGENEVVLPEAVIKNKGLSLGDMIGSDIAAEEKLTGKYRIVGSLKGKALCGFASLEAWQKGIGTEHPEEYGILIYAKKGKIDALNRYLMYLPMTGNDLSSLDSSIAGYKESSQSVYLLLNVIYGSVLIIVSVCLGFLTYLFYHARIKEFAVLHVIGYSRQAIIFQNIFEVAAINLLSWLGGVTAAIFTGMLLNALFISDTGTPLLLIGGETIVLSLCIPMLCIIAQTLSIGISISHTDMVSIIELESGDVL